MSTSTLYDPAAPPSSEAWLGLPEQERQRMVARFHVVNRLKSGNAKAHAAMHVIVENQVAMGFGPTVRAMERLQNQGLSRHDAVHAVGSVLAEHVFTAMRKPSESDSHTLQTQINTAIERLDADTWRKDYGG